MELTLENLTQVLSDFKEIKRDIDPKSFTVVFEIETTSQKLNLRSKFGVISQKLNSITESEKIKLESEFSEFLYTYIQKIEHGKQ